MEASNQGAPSESAPNLGRIWSSRRFELIRSTGGLPPPLTWDFEFIDRGENTAVAYIRKTEESKYEVHLTIPYTDPLLINSIPEICSELPKILRSYMRSKRFK